MAPSTDTPGDMSTALVSVADLARLQAALTLAQEQAAQALVEAADLQAELREMERQLGRAEGELAALREDRKPPAWWRRIFGA